MKKIKIIAEVGVNHNGSLKTAKKLIKELSKLDIDFIKFQLADPYKVYSKDAFKADYQKNNDKSSTVIEMSKRLQLTRDDHLALNEYCKKFNKIYLCSAFDIESLKFLVEKIKIPIVKIPSGEIFSVDMLNYISKTNKEVILSTGMSNLEEIKKAISLIKKNKKKLITVMHCTSLYPTLNHEVNLNFLDILKKDLKLNIGYSDHTLTDEACIGAIAKGASIIEKHVTLNNNQNGPDHKASYSIKRFTEFVKKIRAFEVMLGKKNKVISKKEQKIKLMARKSIVSKNRIEKNSVIRKTDLCFKRPGTGYRPIDIKRVVGKRAKVSINDNSVILKKFLKS